MVTVGRVDTGGGVVTDNAPADGPGDGAENRVVVRLDHDGVDGTDDVGITGDVTRVQRAVGVQASVALRPVGLVGVAAEDDFSIRLDGDGLGVEKVHEVQPHAPHKALVDVAVRQQSRDALAIAQVGVVRPLEIFKRAPDDDLAVRLDRHGFHLAVSLGRVKTGVIAAVGVDALEGGNLAAEIPAIDDLAVGLERDLEGVGVLGQTGVGEAGVEAAVGVEPGETLLGDAVDHFKIAADDDLAVRLHDERAYPGTRVDARVEGRVQAAVGVEPREASECGRSFNVS